MVIDIGKKILCPFVRTGGGEGRLQKPRQLKGNCMSSADDTKIDFWSSRVQSPDANDSTVCDV